MIHSHPFKAIQSFFLGLLAPLFYNYRFGFEDQAIQLTFAKKLTNPLLYPNDPLFDTLGDYPSFFPQIVSLIIQSEIPIAPFFFVAYMVSYGLLFLFTHQLSCLLFKNQGSNLICIFLLLIPSISLGGSSAQLSQFYPSLLALPWIILCFNYFLKGKYVVSFIFLGLLANVHSLLAGYAFTGMTSYFIYGIIVTKRYTLKSLWLPLLFVLFALPTIYWTLNTDNQYSELWYRLMRLRSSHHSFPFSWSINKLVLYGLFFSAFLLTLSITLDKIKDKERREKIVVFVLNIFLLFIFGTVFTEIISIPLFIKLQLFRSSIYINILASVFFGALVNYNIRKEYPLSFLILLITALFLPYNSVSYLTLFIMCAFLFFHSNFTTIFKKVQLEKGVLTSISLMLITAFLLFTSARTSWSFYADLWNEWQYLLICLIAFLLPIAILRMSRTPWVAYAFFLTMGITIPTYYYHSIYLNEQDQNDWINVQKWVKKHTKPDQLFLTPPQKTGFRVFSERSTIGEWKDGTQLYFSAEFSETWEKRMIALEVEAFDGKGYAYLLSNKLDQIAEKYKVNYVVIPTDLEIAVGQTVYSNDTYVVNYIPSL